MNLEIKIHYDRAGEGARTEPAILGASRVEDRALFTGEKRRECGMRAINRRPRAIESPNGGDLR